MNSSVKVKIALSELEKPAERLEHIDAALHRLAAQRVENDVDPVPASELAHGVGKGEVS